MRRDEEWDTPPGPLEPDPLALVLGDSRLQQMAHGEHVAFELRQRGGLHPQVRHAGVTRSDPNIDPAWGDLVQTGRRARRDHGMARQRVGDPGTERDTPGVTCQRSHDDPGLAKERRRIPDADAVVAEHLGLRGFAPDTQRITRRDAEPEVWTGHTVTIAFRHVSSLLTAARASPKRSRGKRWVMMPSVRTRP